MSFYLPPLTYAPGYFCMEEIASTQAKIPVRTKVLLPGLGTLNPSLGKDDLPAESEIELPLWAAEALSKRGYVQIKVPAKYGGSYRELLTADPSVVDLNRLGPHYYEFGLRLASMPVKEAEEIAEGLPDVFQRRLVTVADTANYLTKLLTAGETPTAGQLMKETYMDALEKSLFKNSKQKAEETAEWTRNFEVKFKAYNAIQENK